MDEFLHCCVTGTDPRELVNTSLSKLGDIPESANFGVIYITDALARELEHLIHLLQQGTGVSHWTGTVGIAICASGKEIYDSPAMAIMICEFPQDDFLTIPALSTDSREFAESHRDWIDEKQARFGIVHGNPTNPATPDLIQQLSQELDGGFFVGGLTSSQSEHWQINDGLSQGGISGVLFSESIEVVTGHSQGCSPISPVRTITEAQRNIILKLDGESGLDRLKEDVGEVLARDLSRLGGYIFVGLPIRHSDTGDYMIRNIIGLDTDRNIFAIGELVDEGDKMMFCRRDGNTARTDMQRMLDDLKKRVGERKIKGAVYYSCLGRGRHQFGDNSEELQMINQTLGDIPLVGFFANGEIFNNRLYGFTGVLTLFL